MLSTFVRGCVFGRRRAGGLVPPTLLLRVTRWLSGSTRRERHQICNDAVSQHLLRDIGLGNDWRDVARRG
jgi:hypothetical protein